MTESRKQTDRLRQLQELRAFLDTQIEELTAPGESPAAGALLQC